MNALINMQDSVITQGQRAWTRIKTTAAEQRELWRLVGQALSVGRRSNPSNQGFSKWCQEMGFDMDAPTRSDAMWWASYDDPKTAPSETSHPTTLRKWYRENQLISTLPEDLQTAEIETKVVPTMDARAAEKVGKLARRAASNDEGSDVAQRHLDALAKKHGVSSDDLKEAASVQAPTSFYQFTPSQLEMLEEFRVNVMATVHEMTADGISREAIAKVFMNSAQAVLKGE